MEILNNSSIKSTTELIHVNCNSKIALKNKYTLSISLLNESNMMNKMDLKFLKELLNTCIIDDKS